jgi:RNA polymerase sigma factor (sigma-70 family)
MSYIIQGCVKANRDSQKQFYELLYGYALGICMRYCINQEDAVGILNDGFLKVFKSLHTFKPRHADVGASLKGWMKKIMINTAIDYLRKNHHRYLVTEISDLHYDISEPVETAIDQMSYKEILAVVQQLSPVYRTVFNLYVLDGYKHEEIARQLKISVGASKSNLSKARTNIKKMLQQAGFEYYDKEAI